MAPIEPLDVRERTTSELLSMIAGRSVKWESGVSEISKMTSSEISQRLQVDTEAARKIQAALELVGRGTVIPRNREITCGEHVVEYFRSRLSGYARESFWILTLNQKNRPIDIHRISEGTLSMCPVHPREAYLKALRDSAAGVIFVHNHPSGDPTPSQDDISLTERLCESGKILGIRVLDHLIVGREGFTSFRALELLPSSSGTASTMAAEETDEDSASPGF